MSIWLERKDLINTQQMEVAVNGPDGATHLILCTGVANLDTTRHETYTFLVGPQLSRRQFVGVIASGAISQLQVREKNHRAKNAKVQVNVNLLSILCDFDETSGQIKIWVEVFPGPFVTKLAISYNVNILAELSNY